MRVRLTILTLIISSLFAWDASATHALGAELTYECLGADGNGNSLYRLRLAFLYDCGGFAGPPVSPDIHISSSCLNTVVYLDQQPPVPAQPPFDQYLDEHEIPIYCEESNCLEGSLFGLKEYVYIDTVTLPDCADYLMTYSESNRSNAIETISNPGDQDIYVEAFLNSEYAPCNSSPKFDLPARGFLCQGQDNSMVQTVTDLDGDEIVYSLYTPLVGPGQTVNYTGTYSATNPIENDYLNFDDGVISVWPTEEVITVMGVFIEEYRDGVLVGSVMRDMQVRVVANCPQNPVGLFEYNGELGVEPDSVFICSSDTFRLSVFLDSLVETNNYTIIPENLSDFEGATWEVIPDTANPTSVIGNFVWSPDYGNLNTQTLVLTAFDDACPVVGYLNFTFRFYFHNLLSQAETEDVGFACNGSVTLDVELDGAIPPITYEWQDGSAEPELEGDTAGLYWVTVTDSVGCAATANYNLFIDNYPVADFAVVDICDGEPVNPDNLSINYADPGVTPLNLTDWWWDFGDGSDQINDANPDFTYEEPGTYTIDLIIVNDNDCLDTATAEITINPVPLASAYAPDVCNDSTTQFYNSSTLLSGSISEWLWDFDDQGATSSEQAPIHDFSEVSVYTVTLTATSDKGCVDDTTFEARKVLEATADFEYSIEPFCEEENLLVTLTNRTINATSTIWDFGTSTDIQEHTVYQTPDGEGPLIKLYANADIAGCADTMVVNIAESWFKVDLDKKQVPNVITPNGDGMNDCYAPYFDPEYSDCYHLTVFTRWGIKVFDSADPEVGICWPGRNNSGAKLEGGTYFYVVEINTFQRKGTVLLLE